MFDSGALVGANVPLLTALTVPAANVTAGNGSYVMNGILLEDSGNGTNTAYRTGQICWPKYTRMFYNFRNAGSNAIDSLPPMYVRMLVI